MKEKECIECQEDLKNSLDKEKVQKFHEGCHGWVHCGTECCGNCPYCGE